MPSPTQTLSSSEISAQLECFSNGTQYVKLLRAATVDKGIHAFRRERRLELIDRFTHDLPNLEVVKFVPASGAASRMFKQVYAWVDQPTEHRKEINKFFKRVEELPFFEMWLEAANKSDVETFEVGLNAKVKWLKLLLNDGIKLAELPKGVIPFHRNDHIDSPVVTHLEEAMDYAQGSGGAKVHFTIAKNHKTLFENEVAKAVERDENLAKVLVDYSTQAAFSDTIALDENDEIVLDVNGEQLRRPGGHGALIHNLNEIDADLVFIKNIDNVAHQRFRRMTVESKQMLGGVLLELRGELKNLSAQVSKGLVDAVSIDQVRDKWNLRIPRDYLKLKEYLKRPIRVCGMVKNEGEPGGGPFWSLDKFTGESLQIIEQSQVDVSQMRQEMILNSATHFNPVDIVCAVRDLDEKKIDLMQFVDDNQFFIAQKSYNGQSIKALEWPGLWNGAMAHWITIFVEVPSTTFSPVKELEDLLRPAHLEQ